MQIHPVNVCACEENLLKQLIQYISLQPTCLALGPLGKCLHAHRSNLLERLRSSCLSATVDLSSSSHISTLMRWEFLITIGTSSNISSKPTLAFFNLESERMGQWEKD